MSGYNGIKKGDVIVYEFGFTVLEAKVLKDYGNGYIKVRHNDFPFPFKFLGYRHITHVDNVIKAVD